MAKEEIHKFGTDDGWHGVIKEGGQFPPEKDRYHLYIGNNICQALHTSVKRLISQYRPLLPLRPPGQPRPTHQAS